MNILQCGVVFSLCVLANGDVKRELGFTGIGSYHGVQPNFHHGHKFSGGRNGAVFVPGPSGFGQKLNNFGALNHLGSAHQGFGAVNHNLGNTHQDFGALNHNLGNTHQVLGALNHNLENTHQLFGLNNDLGNGHQVLGGFHNALFTPVLVQPVKGITFEDGWKGMESGSIKEGHAIANAAFGNGYHRAVIPVHEHTNDIEPIAIPNPVKIQSFSGFHLPNFPSYSGHIGAHKGLAPPINPTIGHNFGPSIQTYSTPNFNSNFNVKEPHYVSIKPQKHGFNSNYHSDYKSQSNQGHSFKSHSVNNNHESGHSNHQLKHQSNAGHDQANSAHIADGHGTNGHGGHSHEKATSYQSFVIHSYKPVPVYAKTEHKHDSLGHDGSQHHESHHHN